MAFGETETLYRLLIFDFYHVTFIKNISKTAYIWL